MVNIVRKGGCSIDISPSVLKYDLRFKVLTTGAGGILPDIHREGSGFHPQPLEERKTVMFLGRL